MTAEQQLAKGDAAGFPVPLPDWLPEPVAAEARHLYAETRERGPADQLAMLIRLAVDPRMKPVWDELRHTSRKDGSFIHPALDTAHPGYDVESQGRAMARLFYAIYKLAWPRVAMLTRRNVEAIRKQLLDEAARLRDWANLWASPELEGRRSARAMRILVAAKEFEWAAEEAGNIIDNHASFLMDRDRGDREAHCLAVGFSEACESLFDKKLCGIVARITSVALDREISPERVHEWL